MAARYSKFFRSIHIIGDVFLLNFTFLFVNILYYDKVSGVFTDHFVRQFLYLNLFWGIATTFLKVYSLYRVMRFETVFTTLWRTFLIHLLLILTFVVVFHEPIISYKIFAVKYFIFATLTTSWRLGVLYLLKFLRKRGVNFRNIVILGTGPVASEMYNFFMKHPEHGYRFLGFFTGKNTSLAGSRINNSFVIGPVDQVKDFALKNSLDEIYCAIDEVESETLQDLMAFADDNLIRFKMLPDYRGFVNRRVEINFYDDIPVIILRKEPLDNPANRIIKRLYDTLFSLLVIILVFPWLLPLIALLIRFSSKGPIFFKQLRSGRNNKAFYCYKFRSMFVNGLANELQAKKNDPRITPVGRFLRKTSLDEVPQFFNVLLGDMSIVGPRPHMLHHTEKYSKTVDSFMVRHFVKPGITGLAQVKGFRGETTDPALMEKRIQHDLWYIENWSPLLDTKIIFLTVWNMLKGDKNAV